VDRRSPTQFTVRTLAGQVRHQLGEGVDGVTKESFHEAGILRCLQNAERLLSFVLEEAPSSCRLLTRSKHTSGHSKALYLHCLGISQRPPDTTTASIKMVFPTQQIYVQACRLYSSRAGSFSRGDQVGAAITAAYCCLAFSAPFAGAALVSRNAKNDDRYAKMYVDLPGLKVMFS